MRKFSWLLLCLLFTLSGCGFQLQHQTQVPEQFKIMSFHSDDPYGPLAREVQTLLKNSGVTIDNQDTTHHYPSLRITGASIGQNTVSIYQDAKSAEYQMILTVSAQVIIQGQDVHPISIKVFRSYFDNPATPLAKSSEQDLVIKEMYVQAAEQIVRKLKAVNVADAKLNSQ